MLHHLIPSVQTCTCPHRDSHPSLSVCQQRNLRGTQVSGCEDFMMTKLLLLWAAGWRRPLSLAVTSWLCVCVKIFHSFQSVTTFTPLFAVSGGYTLFWASWVCKSVSPCWSLITLFDCIFTNCPCSHLHPSTVTITDSFPTWWACLSCSVIVLVVTVMVMQIDHCKRCFRLMDTTHSQKNCVWSVPFQGPMVLLPWQDPQRYNDCPPWHGEILVPFHLLGTFTLTGVQKGPLWAKCFLGNGAYIVFRG